jgi:hypothetical protein
VFPLKRSRVQIQRGVGYVYLRRLYQSNRGAEGGPLSHKQGGLIHQIWCAGLAVTLKIDYYYYNITKLFILVLCAKFSHISLLLYILLPSIEYFDVNSLLCSFRKLLDESQINS